MKIQEATTTILAISNSDKYLTITAKGCLKLGWPNDTDYDLLVSYQVQVCPAIFEISMAHENSFLSKLNSVIDMTTLI